MSSVTQSQFWHNMDNNKQYVIDLNGTQSRYGGSKKVTETQSSMQNLKTSYGRGFKQNKILLLSNE